MSKLSTEGMIYTIPMPVDPTYMIISSHKDRIHKELFIMTGITEQEYNKLKHNDDISIVRGKEAFNINADDVLCFGDIDFHKGSDDCKELDTFNWLEHLGIKGICIPSRYDYDKHECTSPKKTYLYTETFKNSELCRYIHGRLGKPKYTLIFRELK